MTEAKNNIVVDPLIAELKALKVTTEQLVRRYARTGNDAAIAGAWRHCAEIRNPSEERIAAADYVRYVEAD